MQTKLDYFNCRVNIIILDFSKQQMKSFSKACHTLDDCQELYEKLKEVVNDYE